MLAALIFATVLTVALGSYVSLCHRTLELSTASLSSTHSEELAEIGIEDGLWALNKWDFSTYTVANNVGTKTISGFHYENGATGQVRIRLEDDAASSGWNVLLVTATATITRPNRPTVTRTLRTRSSRSPLFVNAVAATSGTVKLTAAGTTSLIDSYNSAAGTYSAQTPGYSAVLSAGSPSVAAATVQLTDAQVKGYVATLGTGPSYSTGATLKGPSTPTLTAIDQARLSTSPYQPIFDIKPVTGTGYTLANPTWTTTIGTAGATTPTIYYSNGIDMVGTSKLVVAGPVKVVVNGNFYLGANGGTPTVELRSGGILELYVSGEVRIHGNGIVNPLQLPERVIIYASNTLTTSDMNTATAFHGVVYMPNGDFKVWSNNAIYGSIVARNVTFSGTAPVVHYDENLRNQIFSGIDTPYSVIELREVATGI